jgi:hypothetical protein
VTPKIVTIIGVLDPGYPTFIDAIDPPTYTEIGNDIENVIVSSIGLTRYKLAIFWGFVIFIKLFVSETFT